MHYITVYGQYKKETAIINVVLTAVFLFAAVETND